MRGRVGEGGAFMTITRSLDFDLDLLLLIVLGNNAPMTRFDSGLLLCRDLGVLSSMTSTMGCGTDERGGVLSCDIMNSEVGSPYCIYRMGCSFVTCRSHGTSGYPC